MADEPSPRTTPEEQDPLVIEGEPTKELFVYILTKDIALTRAILDLVDNCIDGARRLRPDGDYNGLRIDINATAVSFSIVDTCGGIPAELARRYAFRFGRPLTMPTTPHSVGQFGVGMKRALFKLGNHFSIESTTDVEHWVVDVDVDAWRRSPGWRFRFNALDRLPEPPPAATRGTSVTVDRLLEQVAREFSLEPFLIRLNHEVAAAHQVSMQGGMTITLNGLTLRYEPSRLLRTADVAPAFRRLAFPSDNGRMVNVRMYCGLWYSVPQDAGWYVFCNGRLLLRADQTNTTGWGEDDETSMPKYHNQYARFRGFVFFESDDASLLPWNTTKTGVDVDSPVFVAVRQQMLLLARPVIDFVNRVHNTPDVSLDDVLIRATSIGTLDLAAEVAFRAPETLASAPPQTTTINYSRTVDQVNRAKRALGVATNRQVGERTFDYYYRLECED